MTRLIEQLAAVCREHPLDEKVLIVPSLAIGHQIADRVGYEGTHWINLRAESIRSLVEGVVGLDVVGEGLTTLSRAQALALIDSACDRVLTPKSYFGRLADQQGLYRAIQRTVDDLRHAGARPGAAPAKSFEDPRKRAELQAIVNAYEDELKTGRYIDRVGLLRRAIGKLRSGKAKPRKAIWMILDSFEMTPAEEEFITLLSGGEPQKIVPSSRPAGKSEAAIDFFRGVGEENEIREVFRRLLEAESLDSAELLYSVREIYLPLVFELASEYGIDCTYAEGVAATFTRPGQGVVGFLRWIASDFDAADLGRTLSSGVIATPDDISPLAMARVLRNASIGWGRDRYARRLDVLVAQEEKRESPYQKKNLERIAVTRKVTDDLLEIVPVIVSGRIDFSMLAASASQFVNRYSKVMHELDVMARAGLERMFDELAVLPPSPAPVVESCERLIEAVRQLHVGASNPRPGHLHVASLRTGGYSGRLRTFFVGLDDSKYPGAGLQDPILLDDERRRINEAITPSTLPIIGDQPQRNVEGFWRVLALVTEPNGSAHREVTLGFSSRNLLDEREQFPASVLLETYRIATGHGAADYEELARELPQAAFVPRRQPLSESEWWLEASRTRKPGELAEAVGEAYAWIADGAEAARQRDSDALTAWDGKIVGPAAVLDPRVSGKVLSCSQIEGMARCPFSYFMKRLLRVEPLEELKRDPNQWLEAYELGNVLHTIFQRFMEEITERREKPSYKRHHKRLMKIAAEELEKIRLEVPPPNDGSFEVRRLETKQACETFLRTEEVFCSDVTPLFYEVPFGFEEPSSCEIASSEPLSLALKRGRKVLLRGRIDRVDQRREGELEVWDYKTGNPLNYEKPGDLHSGQMIQHAVYALAAGELMRRKGKQVRVGKSGYFFASGRGEGSRVTPVQRPGALESALDLLFDVIADGLFIHGGEEACKFCDYADLSEGLGRALERTARKLENPANEGRGVTSWQRLQDVE